MKEKIVYMTDMNLKTGFGIVAHNVCNGLAEAGYEVFYIGWGFKADSGFRRGNYTLLPIGNGPFGEDVLAMYLQQLKPEILVIQCDTRMCMYVPNELKKLPNKPTYIMYPVIDGCVWDYENQRTKWPSNWTATIKQADKVVAMTDFGKNILKANGVESTRIYHGVDTSLYKPVSEEVRAQIKMNTGLGKDTFVFGGIFKNMQRKNPEKYLQAFKILLESKHLSKEERNKLVLLLHTNPQPMGGGEFDLVQQAVDYGLELGKNVVFSNMQLPPENMPLIFQVMNAYIHLGGMQGFCIPLIEAMSTGLPIIAVDSCTHSEILGDSALISETPTYDGKHRVTFGSYNGVECDIPNPWDIAQKMENLYKEKSLREELGMKASQRAVKVFDWSIIKKEWVDLVKSLIIDETKIPEEWKKLYEQTKV